MAEYDPDEFNVYKRLSAAMVGEAIVGQTVVGQTETQLLDINDLVTSASIQRGLSIDPQTGAFLYDPDTATLTGTAVREKQLEYTNLIPNSGFEDIDGQFFQVPSDIDSDAIVQPSSNGVEPYSGVYALELETDDSAEQWGSFSIPVEVGQTYTFQAKVRVTSNHDLSPKSGLMRVGFTNNVGTYTTIDDTGWATLSVTGVVTTDVVTLTIAITGWGDAPTGLDELGNTVTYPHTFFVDEVMFEKAATVNPYYDSGHGGIYYWSGLSSPERYVRSSRIDTSAPLKRGEGIEIQYRGEPQFRGYIDEISTSITAEGVQRGAHYTKRFTYQLADNAMRVLNQSVTYESVVAQLVVDRLAAWGIELPTIGVGTPSPGSPYAVTAPIIENEGTTTALEMLRMMGPLTPLYIYRYVGEWTDPTHFDDVRLSTSTTRGDYQLVRIDDYAVAAEIIENDEHPVPWTQNINVAADDDRFTISATGAEVLPGEMLYVFGQETTVSRISMTFTRDKLNTTIELAPHRE